MSKICQMLINRTIVIKNAIFMNYGSGSKVLTFVDMTV